MPLVVQELLTLLEPLSYYRLLNKSNTTYASSDPGTANPSGAPELTAVFVEFVLLNV